MDEVTKATFDPYVGEWLPVEGGDGVDELEVVVVEALPRHGSPREEPFSVTLRSRPSAPTLEQSIHRFRLGDEPLEIFIVPNTQDAEGRTIYQAVFN